ncbi:unnamed protein product [Haemonchus placei]|uniref:CHK domain-containing protein n=1 Tax=Haemonchus placei TaxID=6290 RepID=A0A0N4WV32_HAEPC|nr:unnamed protein product [Haemonchus placei]
MSLFTPADGILRTNTHWDDLQESIFKAFGPDAKFGPNKDVKDIGSGRGFMSRMCLVSPDWITKTDGAPEKFIVKICSQLPMQECHGLDETGYFSSDDFAKAFENDVKRPLKAIAKLEAAATKFSEEEKEHFEKNPFDDLFEKFFNKQSIDALFTMMRSLGSSRLDDKIDQLEKIVPEIIDIDHIKNVTTSLGMKKVLCHGDLWSTNLIWRKGEKDLELAAVVDFQTAHFGLPTTDITRVLCACMSGKDRRDNWESLLEKFYSYLEVEMEKHDMPYTLDQLKEAYRQYFPLGAFLIVPMIGPLFQVVNTSNDVEYKAKVEEAIFEKVECLLEDICEFHRENKQRSGDKSL